MVSGCWVIRLRSLLATSNSSCGMVLPYAWKTATLLPLLLLKDMMGGPDSDGEGVCLLLLRGAHVSCDCMRGASLLGPLNTM